MKNQWILDKWRVISSSSGVFLDCCQIPDALTDTGLVPICRLVGSNQLWALVLNECIGDLSSNESRSFREARFYEQVTGVKVCSLFFLHRAFAFVVALGFVALHRVSIRTLMSCLCASSVPVGVREESRCCYLSVGLRRPKRARSHRNTVSSQRVNMGIS
jgi:hypothetical protein